MNKNDRAAVNDYFRAENDAVYASQLGETARWADALRRVSNARDTMSEAAAAEVARIKEDAVARGDTCPVHYFPPAADAVGDAE